MNNEYFWSIVIEQDNVQAGLWTIKNENISVLSGSQGYPWETDDNLVEKADTALSEVGEALPEGAHEPNKTVFGVPASWVEEGSIKKPHLDKIRLVSQKLSLTPTGFVVLPEAIAHAVKIKEGSPLSGIVIGVGAGSLDVTVFRLGNIVGTVSVGRSASLIEDMVEGLSRFSGGSVPTRWLLYDGRGVALEEVKQELLRADWSEAGDLKFLHTPQVEIVSDLEKVEAVSIAGASEMGNIKGIEGQEPHEVVSNVAATNDFSPEDLGFAVDSNIREQKVGRKIVPALPAVHAPSLSFLKKFRLPSFSFGGKRAGVLLAGVLLILLVGLGLAWFYFPRAEITIYISPKNLQDTEVVVLDENIELPEPGSFTFPAVVVETEVASEKTKSTTGTRTVGDRAKGRVNIRNGTADEVTFESGTTLTGPNDLEFEMDEGVTIPAASSPSTPGEAAVGVTASAIGADYNLAANESFAVSNFPKSEVDAVSSEDFSGGSSREAQAISGDDIESLRDELLEELKASARSNLESQASSARFVADSSKYETVDESASGKAGDEAESVTVSMTITARGLTIGEEQVSELSAEILKDQIPEGFNLRSEQVETEFQLVDEVESGVWEFDIALSANLLPTVDKDQIKRDVAGRHPTAVEERLAKIPGYQRSEVTVRPKLPGFLGNIPRLTQNISVEVVSAQ